ncbi:phage major capsid protein, P2 family [Novosphingopyxis sp. YJ-S2-01]|uniref:phage major capsid protein, P2 family n=1 Tax=Novosphingopyxis sp. YJ-S2-01 TaxID=2794021 RepID=UPI0018DAFB00|nr:phage major capsid protein, P2 family [Novosphingopyxis sp. YJ-S2-01]MBH9536938.1 phage major capsid protein, P2 family [Novosphingopyxis sp. YJ-S2-01]
MRNSTRQAFDAYVSQIAELNGVSDATKKFAVEPSVQQRLIDKKQESSEFLSKINLFTVPEMKGEKLGLGVSSPIASRSDTRNGERREPTDPSGLDVHSYELHQTNFDTYLSYGKIDMWAKFPDFQTRIRDHIVRAAALDHLRIGFNGTSAAKSTDKAANPLLQDVNIGWLEKMRLEAPERVMAEAAAASGKVTYGDGGDYASLDALVYDATNSLLAPWAVEDTELVAIVSRDLLHDKYFPLMNTNHDPENQLARDVIMSSKRLGGLPAVRVPFFPAGKVFITRYDNLSIYAQEGKHRRLIKDEPEWDRVVNYESDNDAYVIEDHDYGALVENIEAAQQA